MIKINTSNYKQIIQGGTILSTAGGLKFVDQMRSMKQIGKFEVYVKTISDFKPQSYVALVAEIGKAEAPPINKSLVIKKMMKTFSKLTGKKIVGLYPFEIGQESITLESAHFLNLPIVDWDISGVRARPFLDVDIFNTKKIPFSYSPLVFCDDQGKIFSLPEKLNSSKIEKMLRDATSLSKTGVIFLIGGLISIEEIIKHKLDYTKPYHIIYNLGSYKTLEQLVQKINPKISLLCRVTSIKTLEVDGFTCLKIDLDTKSSQKYQLLILNETMMLINQNGEIVSSIPDKILVLDDHKLIGIHGDNLCKGKILNLLVVKPQKQWQSKAALKIFGPDRINFLKDI